MAVLGIPWSRLASVAISLGMLSGCAILERQGGGKPGPSETSEPSQPPTASPQIPPIPPAKPPVEAQLDPQRLVGLDEAGVMDLIGTPQDVREEAPARVWHYAGDKCSVEVLFYFDLTKKQFRALTYRVEPAGKSDMAQRICLGGIQEAKSGGTKR